MNKITHYFEVNRETWNQKTLVHVNSDFYNLKDFKAGKNSLNRYELEALGDVKGKSLLHLQCHFGQDTLSWSRLGAVCTGVDISDEGIKLAKNLANEMNLSAKFICSNALDIEHTVTGTFDIVFASYGVLGWLPDLKPWAQAISSKLKKGGIFYMVEFHPIAWMFDYTGDKPKMKYSYNQKEVIYEEYKGTYADVEADMISKEYCWNHSIGDVLNALVEAGLNINYLNEYEESPYNIFPNLTITDSGMFAAKAGLFPLIFEIKATKC